MKGAQPDARRPIYGRWAEADDRLVLAIVDNVTGQGVGEAVLNDWDAGNRSCGFRILIGAAGQGRGLGTEATRLTVQHALGPMGLHRLSLEVYDINPAPGAPTRRPDSCTRAPAATRCCSTIAGTTCTT